MDEKEKSQEQVNLQANQSGAVAPTMFNFFDPNQFGTMQRYCQMYASSDLVPEAYQIKDEASSKKAVGNCMIAMDIALRIGASPLMVMQNMVPIYGKPSWSSKFLIATINACGRFKPLKYKIVNKGKIGTITYTEYEKVYEQGRKYPKNVAKQATFDGSQIDNIECIAYTTEKNGEDVMESTPVDLIMAIREGWYTKAGSKWQTMPIKMLKYRAASFWANEYAPELSMGIYTIEENEDIHNVTEDIECQVLASAPTTKRVKVDVTAPQGGKTHAENHQTTTDNPPQVIKAKVAQAPIIAPPNAQYKQCNEEDCGY